MDEADLIDLVKLDKEDFVDALIVFINTTNFNRSDCVIALRRLKARIKYPYCNAQYGNQAATIVNQLLEHKGHKKVYINCKALSLQSETVRRQIYEGLRWLANFSPEATKYAELIKHIDVRHSKAQGSVTVYYSEKPIEEAQTSELMSSISLVDLVAEGPNKVPFEFLLSEVTKFIENAKDNDIFEKLNLELTQNECDQLNVYLEASYPPFIGKATKTSVKISKLPSEPEPE